MVISKKCNFEYEVQNEPVKLTVTVGNGFPSTAWSVAIGSDMPLAFSRPEDLELKRRDEDASICDQTLGLVFAVDRTNTLAPGAVATIQLNGKEFHCERPFSEEEKAADVLTVQFRIKVKLICP